MDRTNEFRRGDTSPEHPGKVFSGNNHGRLEWVTPERLTEIQALNREGHLRRREQRLTRIRERLATEPEFKRKRDEAIRNWQKRNPHKTKAAMRKWLGKPGSREKARAATAAWVATPEGRKVKRAVYHRYLKTVNGTIINRIRSRIAVALKQGHTKSTSTLELIGCSIEQFKAHLAKQFEPQMSWENMGLWEIDHRAPLAGFNLADPEQQKVAFNFHNCRPMWKAANQEKSDKIEGELFSARQLRAANIIPFQKIA